jgi:hypothetical protein
MNTPDRLLETLTPPAGGLQRLIRRRDEDSYLLPLAVLTSAVAAIAFAFPWSVRHPVELKLNGARLVGERSQGTTLRMLDDRKTVAMPSGDPNVSLYWIEQAPHDGNSDAQR